MFNIFRSKDTDKTLFFHTDIHSHIVPGVDDGSPDLNTSVSLAKELNALGIEHIIATPHVTEVTFENTAETLSAPFESLKAALKAENVNVAIEHAAEYRLDGFFERSALAPRQFMLYPNNYILIENSFIQQALNFEQIVFDLKTLGLTPVLAHPERYAYYSTRKKVYQSMHDFEIQFQVNILSFSGYYGHEVKETAFWLLKNGLVDFIGTDLHRATHIELIKKFIGSSDYKKLVKNADVKNDTAFR